MDEQELSIVVSTLGERVVEMQGMFIWGSWESGDVGIRWGGEWGGEEVWMGESTGERLISEKDCWENDPPKTNSESSGLGMDDTKEVKILTRQVEGPVSSSRSLSMSWISPLKGGIGFTCRMGGTCKSTYSLWEICSRGTVCSSLASYCDWTCWEINWVFCFLTYDSIISV